MEGPIRAWGFDSRWPNFRTSQTFPVLNHMEQKFTCRGGTVKRNHILPIGGWLRTFWEYDLITVTNFIAAKDWQRIRIPGISEPLLLDCYDSLALDSLGQIRSIHTRNEVVALPYIYGTMDPEKINCEFIFYHGDLKEEFVREYHTNCPIFVRMSRDIKRGECLYADIPDFFHKMEWNNHEMNTAAELYETVTRPFPKDIPEFPPPNKRTQNQL